MVPEVSVRSWHRGSEEYVHSQEGHPRPRLGTRVYRVWWKNRGRPACQAGAEGEGERGGPPSDSCCGRGIVFTTPLLG